jgi:hypothetical protein
VSLPAAGDVPVRLAVASEQEVALRAVHADGRGDRIPAGGRSVTARAPRAPRGAGR